MSDKNTEASIFFEIEDTGVGISDSAISKMFTPFTQADSSTRRKFGGTGLGLSICKKLVEQMKGHMGVESAVGKGSKFYFYITLPIGNSESQVSSVQHRNVIPQERKIRVLVADDNTINQQIAVKMLEKIGVYADVVGNGLEALKALAERPYDLVLMDCQMPEMDGYEATRQIRTSGQTASSHIPIIAMTANAMKGDAEKCIEAGMNDYLTKPMTLEKLEERVAHWVKVVPQRILKIG